MPTPVVLSAFTPRLRVLVCVAGGCLPAHKKDPLRCRESGKNGGKRIRAAGTLHAMQWAVWLRVAALQALWGFVALRLAPSPAPALGRLSRCAGGAQAR